MNAVKQFFRDVKPIEYVIFLGSVAAILLSFFLTKNTDYLQLTASLIGALALILVAKGNVAGQILSVVFSVFYGVVAFYRAYYGEIITYLGMSAPIAVLAVVTWLKHPFHRNKSEVTVNHLKWWEYPTILAISLAVSVAFFFILKALDTANLWWSTVSVLTSSMAMILSVRRSPLYAFGYLLNDGVLIVLWAIMLPQDRSCLAMVVCFVVFFVNDVYGLVNWLRLLKKQEEINRRQKTGDGASC